jgi:predicted nuclease of predicted toxin-antitoxin system
VVVTKDADFVSAHVISGSPARPLLVSTGNIGNDELEVRLLAQLPPIEECLMAPGFVELTRDGLVIHES